MKKSYLGILSLLTLFGAYAADGDTFTIGQLNYSVLSETDKMVSVTGATDNTIASIEIPAFVTNGTTQYQVTTIANNAFRAYSSLKSVTLPYTLTSIGQYAFAQVPISTIDIPGSVTLIDKCAFESSGLVSVTIPAGVSEVSDQCFHSCKQLKSVYIPSLLSSKLDSNDRERRYIRASAFSSCSALEEVTLPANLTNLSLNSFYGCSALKVINSFPAVPPTASNAMNSYNPFSGVPSTCVVNVPAGSAAAYMAIPEWAVLTISEGTLPSVTAVSSLTVSPATVNMEVGQSGTVMATVAPSNATDPTIVWQTSAPNVAVVNQSGTVTALANGKATITASTIDGSDIVKTIDVTVGAATVEDNNEFNLDVTPAQGLVGELKTIDLVLADFNKAPDYYIDADITKSKATSCTIKRNGTVVYTLAKTDIDNAYNGLEEQVRITLSKTLTEPGEYVLEIPAGVFSVIEGQNFSSVKNKAPLYFKWTITKPVEYTLEPTSVSPKEGEINLADVQLESFRLRYPGLLNTLDPKGAAVTITSEDADYSYTGRMTFNLNYFGTATEFIIWIPSDVRIRTNGTYTVSIPQGVLGDEEWLQNMQQVGLANKAIDLKFTVTGGRLPGNISYTLRPESTLPTNYASVESLTKVVLTYDEPVFIDPNVAIQVFAGWGGRYEGTVTASKDGDNTVVLTFNPTPIETGEYSILIPDGAIGDATYNATHTEGKANSESTYTFNLTSSFEMKSTTPAEDSEIAGIEQGGRIVFNTSNNDAVAYVDFEIEEYNPNTQTTTVVLRGTADKRTDAGAFYWQNDDSTLRMAKDHIYTITYKVYDAENLILYSSAYNVVGTYDTQVGVDMVSDYDTCVKIFNLNGVEVKGNLPAGIYIMNGKKVIVK